MILSGRGWNMEAMIKEYENDPSKIWESNVFGKSLHELVNDGLKTFLSNCSL